MLLHVQRNGDSGSPRVSGIDKLFERCLDAGLRLLDRWRPAPGPRTRPLSLTPASISRRPLRIVARARPVADDTNASPPYPIARDSVAAQSRRARSSSTPLIAAYFATIVSSMPVSRRTSTFDHPVIKMASIFRGRRASGLREVLRALSYSMMRSGAARRLVSVTVTMRSSRTTPDCVFTTRT